MGDWEKGRYRNLKRNFHVLISLGNGEVLGPEELGKPNRLLGWLLLRWLCLPVPPVRTQIKGSFAPLCQAGLAQIMQSSQQLVLHSSIPSEPVTRASQCLFLLKALCFQDKGFVSFQVSGLLDQLSCVTAGRPPSSRSRTLRILMKNGLQGSKVRGRRNQSCPPHLDLL